MHVILLVAIVVAIVDAALFGQKPSRGFGTIVSPEGAIVMVPATGHLPVKIRNVPDGKLIIQLLHATRLTRFWRSTITAQTVTATGNRVNAGLKLDRKIDGKTVRLKVIDDDNLSIYSESQPFRVLFGKN